MKKFSILLLTLIASGFLAGCASAPPTNQSPAPASTPDELASARATYAQFCIRCHKPDGSGGIFELEDGTKLKVPSLSAGRALKDSDKEFAEQITNGGDGMPAFKNKLEPERIDALVRFIRQEFQGQATGGSSSPAPSH